MGKKSENLSCWIVLTHAASFSVFKIYLTLMSTFSLEWPLYSITLIANNKNFHFTLCLLYARHQLFTQLFSIVLIVLQGRYNYLHLTKDKADQWMFHDLLKATQWSARVVDLPRKPRPPHSTKLLLQFFSVKVPVIRSPPSSTISLWMTHSVCVQTLQPF